MAFDGIVTKAINTEITPLCGARIDKVFEPNKNEIILGLYLNGCNYALNICIEAQNCRINLTTHSKPNPQVAPNFCMLLRKNLIGLKLKNIITFDLERLIILEFEGFDELDDIISKKLVIELMGKHSNIILLDDNNVIIDSLRHIKEIDENYRDILPHTKYTFPTSDKDNFLELSNFEAFFNIIISNFSDILEANNINDLANQISSTFNGISKSFINSIINKYQIKKVDKSNLEIIFNYIIGYIRISIEGYYIERFINICGNEKITIWNLKRNKNVKLELNIGIKDLKKVAKIAKQTKCKIKIIKKKGLPFLFNRYRKRKLFFVFLLVIIIGLGISSNFVWNIQIVEEDKESIENLYQDVVESGLEIGKMKSKINTKDIINKVRLKRNDIAWMGIELKGTNAIVKVVKATAKPEIVDDNEYCNIVSDKQGIITKINAQNGTIAVKVGDTVNVGTTLINGWMEGKYTGLRYVHAKGEIQAKVWHTKNKKILYNATEKTETGNIENKYQIKINNFEINLSKRLSKFKIYDTIVLENKFKIFSDFYLPISLVKITNKEIKEEQKNYNAEQAKDLGIEQLQEELDNEIEDKSKVVNKIINTYEKEDGIEVYVTYEVLEDIGTNEKIVF